jgi:hypothetical protein
MKHAHRKENDHRKNMDTEKPTTEKIHIQRVCYISSRNLPMLKGAYKSYVEVRNKIYQKNLLLLYEEIQ